MTIESKQAMAAKGKTKIITVLTTSSPGWVSVHKCQCMMAITIVWSHSSWVFP